jgi:hypothetical protein
MVGAVSLDSALQKDSQEGDADSEQPEMVGAVSVDSALQRDSQEGDADSDSDYEDLSVEELRTKEMRKMRK